jgi:hypothetical protein
VWDLDEFGLQFMQVIVIEVKPALKHPIGHPLLVLEEVEDLGQDLIRRHIQASIRQQPLSL